jgi:hypothetical protein
MLKTSKIPLGTPYSWATKYMGIWGIFPEQSTLTLLCDNLKK